MYEFIKNPINNKKVKINSKSGKSILKKYLLKIYGGAGSDIIPDIENNWSIIDDNYRVLQLNEQDIIIHDSDISEMIVDKHQSTNKFNLHYFTLNTESKELCIMLKNFENEMYELAKDCNLKKGKINREIIGNYFLRGPEFIFKKEIIPSKTGSGECACNSLISIDMMDSNFFMEKSYQQRILTTSS